MHVLYPYTPGIALDHSNFISWSFLTSYLGFSVLTHFHAKKVVSAFSETFILNDLLWSHLQSTEKLYMFQYIVKLEIVRIFFHEVA